MVLRPPVVAALLNRRAARTVLPAVSLISLIDGRIGDELVAALEDDNHNAAIGVLGEILPDERNWVSLHPTE